MSAEPRPPSPTLIPRSTRRNDRENSGDASGAESEPRRHTQIFTLPNGNPVVFFLHASLTPGQREMTTGKIIDNGGVLTTNEKRANVILVSPNRLGTVSLETLRLGWEANPNPALRGIRVEPIAFLTVCINSGRFDLDNTVRKKQRLSGRPGMTEPRIEFTPEDDASLCRWLADRVPNKDDGGRTGNTIYTDLEKLGHANSSFDWVKRHPWQSWRNRYVKNQAELDPEIDQWVLHRRRADRKGEYAYSRFAPPRRGNGARYRAVFHPDESEEDEEEEVHNEEEDDSEGHDLQAESPRAQKRRHTDGEEATRKHERSQDVIGRKRRRTDGHDAPEVEIGRGGAMLGGRQTVERGSSIPFEEIPFEEEEEDSMQFESAGDTLIPFEDEGDYAFESQAGPSGTHRSPTPENTWDEFTPTLAPQASPPTQHVKATKGPTSKRARAKAAPSTKPETTITSTNNNRKGLNVARGARKKTAPLAPPAGFRVTRARSQPLEPTLATATATEPTKTEGKSRASALVPVVEDRADDEREEAEEAEEIPAVPSFAAISGRTLDEENAVDNLLNDGELEPEDDAQTRRAFEAAQENDEDGEDAGVQSRSLNLNLSALDRHLSRHKTRRSSRAPSVIAARANPPLFDAQNRNGAPSVRSSMAPPSQLFTPLPYRRTRSTHIPDPVTLPLFPSPGTRAKAVKDTRERESKGTPYEPPSGTRASAHKARRLG
ncbi:hypothetical protein HWV62_13138 [Athelia sp. TMB]|nr:hypothetical protein HWV62_13138 [Athelia sp. TMB]